MSNCIMVLALLFASGFGHRGLAQGSVDPPPSRLLTMSEPRPGSTEVPETQVVRIAVLGSRHPPTQASIEQSFALRTRAGTPIAGSFSWRRGGFSFVPNAPLPSGTDFVVSPGLGALNQWFSTVPQPRVDSVVLCSKPGGLTYLQVRFSSLIRTSTLLASIGVEQTRASVQITPVDSGFEFLKTFRFDLVGGTIARDAVNVRLSPGIIGRSGNALDVRGWGLGTIDSSGALTVPVGPGSAPQRGACWESAAPIG